MFICVLPWNGINMIIALQERLWQQKPAIAIEPYELEPSEEAYDLYSSTVGKRSPLFCGAAEGKAKALEKVRGSKPLQDVKRFVCCFSFFWTCCWLFVPELHLFLWCCLDPWSQQPVPFLAFSHLSRPVQEGKLQEAFEALAEAFGVHARCDSVHPTPLFLSKGLVGWVQVFWIKVPTCG